MNRNVICDCDLFKKGMEEINGYIMLGLVHGMKYQSPPFSFCPWCGKELIEQVEEPIREISEKGTEQESEIDTYLNDKWNMSNGEVM